MLSTTTHEFPETVLVSDTLIHDDQTSVTQGTRKRTVAPYGDYPAKKRQAHADGPDLVESASRSSLTLRLLISQQEAAVVIGKGGVKISSIRESSHANVSVSSNGSSQVKTPVPPAANLPRILSISGSQDQVFHALDQVVHQLLVHHRKQIAAFDGQDPELTIQLLLPQGIVGRVIGKSGATISTLRANTHASINVAQDLMPYSTEKLVTLTGLADNIQSAIEAIASMMANAPSIHNVPYQPNALMPTEESMSLMFPPIPMTHTLSIPSSKTALLIGRNGANIARIRNRSSANIKIHSNPNASSEDPNVIPEWTRVDVVGFPRDIHMALSMIHASISSLSSQ